MRQLVLLLGVKTGWTYTEITQLPLHELEFYTDQITRSTKR